MRESLKIIKQLLNNLPTGPVLSDNLKMVPPSRFQMRESMENLIHHFKLFTEGFAILQNSAYFAVEAPKGEFESIWSLLIKLNPIVVILGLLDIFIYKVLTKCVIIL